MLADLQDQEDSPSERPTKPKHSPLRVRSDLHEEYSSDEIAKMTDLYEGTLSNIEEGEIVKSKVLRVTDTAVDRKSTRLNSSHLVISYAVFCLKKKNIKEH